MPFNDHKVRCQGWLGFLVTAWVYLLCLDGSISHAGTRHVELGFEWESFDVGEGSRQGFKRIDAADSGIRFVNHLAEASAEKNRILENGSGVAAGDVDGDGWIDLYFCRLEGGNVLYRNLGGFRFEEMTSQAGVALDDQASTGAVFVDLDGDRDIDLLVSGISSGVRLFMNDGDGKFSEIVESGLDKSSGSMSMALADADQDGDLDLYVSNYRNVTWKDLPPGVKPRVSRVGGKPVASPKDRFVASLRKNGSTAITEIGQPDGFYLNDGNGSFESVDWLGGRFLDEAGIPLESVPRHWGLSVAFRDFNKDGLPDLYVCNDFLYGNDDFFLNQGKATFQRIGKGAIRHSSWSSMAVDVADIDRDGNFDFMVVDMLSQSLTRRLIQRANYETGSQLRQVGLFLDRPQQQHNTLFLSRGDGSFAEIAHLAGVEASEWSWSLAFLDVDLDGYEDILVGNGHAHDLLDGDTTMDAMRAMRSAPRGQVPRTLLMYPRLDLPDVAFRNQGDLTFADVSDEWGFNVEGVSSALCRADLDRDGDWDVVVNRLQAEAVVYENIGNRPRISISLRGHSENTGGAGSLLRLIPVGESDSFPVQQQELVVGGRYLSTDAPAIVFAAGKATAEFRLEVAWASGAISRLDGIRANRSYWIDEPNNNEVRDRLVDSVPETSPWFRDVPLPLNESLVNSQRFDDRIRQPLLPRTLSQQGRGIAWADFENDGYENLIVTGGSSRSIELFVNEGGERFRRNESIGAEEMTGGIWMNIADDEFRYVVGLSNYRTGKRSQGSVGIFEWKEGGLKLEYALAGQGASVGPIVSFDYDSDGDLDLFVGSRVLPGRYPEPPISRLFRNETGRFRLDLENSRSLVDLGMVNAALALDIDGDSDTDLALALDWGPVQIWSNEAGTFVNRTEALGLSRYKGWWNGLAAGDFNEDGRMDLVASNWGRNTKYERYRDEPIRLSYGDIDRTGTLETFEQVYDPERSRWEGIRDLIVMGTAVPSLQQRTHSYREYAEMGLKGAFGAGIEALDRHEGRWLESSVFINRGDSFELAALPIEAQFAPAFGVVVGDFDGDGHEDVFLAQNFFASDPSNPRQDAGLGLLLEGLGDGRFQSVSSAESGISVLGEQRGAAAADFDRDGRLDLAVTQLGASTRLFQNEGASQAHRVILVGPEGNRQAVGAQMRLGGRDARGPMRALCGGSGLQSQNSFVTLWQVSNVDQALTVHWPDGTRSEITLSGLAKEWTIAYEKATRN